MPRPDSLGWSLAVRVGAQQAVLDAIDGGIGPGEVKIYGSDDTLLCTIPLTSPCGFLEPGTGVLTLTYEDEYTLPVSMGVASYGVIQDGSGLEVCILPCAPGSAQIPNYLVLESLLLDSTIPIQLSPLTIG